MPRQKYHRDRVYQVVGEPGLGAVAVGYVRYSSELQDPTTIATQKRCILEFAEKKGWKILRWYEEPEQSAKYEEIEDRPIFAQLLKDAGKQFQIVLCSMNSRWSRNVVVAYTSLTQLRKQRLWWATADGLWDIDKVQQDGFDVAFAVDTQINASYIRQLSRRTIDGKEDRARAGYHNGSVPFGYLDPEYPKAPDGAPSTWRPPRMPVRPDPETFPALVRIGELVAEGWTDRAIANELERGGYLSKTARFGERLLTKDTIAAIRRSWFPREFASGSSYGTIDTPSGELVEGKHQAAWPYELWQRMVEVKANKYLRSRKDTARKPHEFSRIIVCAACRRPLRVSFGSGAMPYYRDTSIERKLPCPIQGIISVRSSLVVARFGEILRAIELPAEWRKVIVERSQIASVSGNDEIKRVQQRRKDLEAEQKRLLTLFTKGYIAEDELDGNMDRIHTELLALPVAVQHPEETVQEALSMGETLVRMADYWSDIPPEERRDIVWSLLRAEGLIYDLERQVIVGLLPRDGVMPVLALGLESTKMWERCEDSLWLRQEYWPPHIMPTSPHLPPPQKPGMTPAQQEQAIMLIRQGMSLRQVADLLGTSYQSVYRLVKKEGIVLQPCVAKLTSEQVENARALIASGVSQRQIAKQLGVSKETLRRSLQRSPR
ncbi:MAG: hypothetical protein NVS2B12_10910 [Ktedonobacteraceae bacterium]